MAKDPEGDVPRQKYPCPGLINRGEFGVNISGHADKIDVFLVLILQKG